jgi:hypothetical protein
MTSPSGRTTTGSDADTGEYRFVEPEPDSGPAPDEPLFDPLLKRLAELREYCLYYLTSQMDLWKLRGRRLALWSVVAVAGFLVILTAIVVATTLLMIGIAHGLGALFGDRFWLGDLLTGLGFLLVLAGGSVFGFSRLNEHYRRQTRARYERRKAQQRSTFGQDVSHRAPDPPSPN